MRYLRTYENYCPSDIYEYQYREIVNTYYKRKKGTKIWSFTTEEDFNKNSTPNNTIEWEEEIKI